MLVALALSPYSSESIDSRVFEMAMLVIPAVSGLSAVWAGLLMRLGRLAPARVRSSGWHEECVRWGVVPPGRSGAQLEEDISQSWTQIRSFAVMGAGIGLLLGTSLSAVISLATTGTLRAVTIMGLPQGLGLFLPYVIGYCSGLALGVAHARRTMTGVPTYGDVRPRTLSRYRSPLVPAVCAGVIIVDILATLYLWPHIGKTVWLHVLPGDHLVFPATPWVLGAIPLVLAFVLALQELGMLWMVRLPRLVNVGSPIVSQRADDMLRPEIMAVVQSFGVMAFTAIGIAQWDLLSSSPASHGLMVYQWGTFIVPFAPMLLLLIGIVRALPRTTPDWKP